MKTILISGANGFIATNFISKFSKKYKFIKLSHKPQFGHVTLIDLATNTDLLYSIDVIINLAGANIGEKRWSISRKDELLSSRLETTASLVALFNNKAKLPHLISASAIGIYSPNQVSDEDIPIDYQQFSNFSQQLTKQWESIAKTYKGSLTITRFGVVLSNYGGAFPKILKPFLLCVGGPIGNGRQNFSWISLIDTINALDYVLHTSNTGIYNFVAPQIITNDDLTKQISTIWHRPHLFKLSSSMIKLLFGQMGQELFLNNLIVAPKKLITEKFNYHYPDIQSCLTAIKTGMF